ncbi:hypothetical protein K2173_021332 [Erythroxylum novogranatense]|uniref:RPW8 domain-containing protein n=1 Tax=Erythroxylum novogranatense TaxID=1862640 RepID=A0AAV8TXW3_9ROSI|nr:hypothetical protein K2173_021332 [Erythroxylum novogranatense]
MAVSLLASSATGAGLELLFGSFLDLVVEVTKKNILFQPTLKRLETTLKSLQPKIKQIDAFNLDMDRPKEIDGLKVLIIKGQKLVIKCSNTNQYNFIMKPIYTEKLLKLEEEIRRYIDIDMQVQQSVDTKETLFEVKHMSLEVRQISEQFKQLSSIGSNSGSFSRSGFTGVCSPPGLKGEPVGLEAPLNDLKKKLLEDEVPLIVLSAPGGCGKTTMALAVCQDEDILEKFQNNIFFITVSKSPSLLVIVERLFQHKGQKVPKYRNDNDLVVLLENFFRNMTSEPVLLVLDDLWSGSEYILDKLNFQIENYRILVTSRSELSSFDSTYKLQTLNKTDALTLFRQSALPQGGNFCISDEDVSKILNSCGGFPLAISVIGKSLYRKSAAEWRKRVKECSKASAIMSKSEFGILECLQSSVDALDEKVEVKECFIDLGSFPEDQRTSATTLIDMWVELHKIDEDDAMTNLHELCDRNLVDLVVMRKDSSDVDCSYNEHFAKQHDLLRDLAIRQSDSGSIEHRRRLFLDITGNRVEPKQLLIDANLLSISTDEMFTSHWSGLQLRAPKVEALVLNIRTKNYNLPEFVQTMIDLKVLIVTNYGFSTTELSNFELLSSLSSLRRIRLEKLFLPSSLLSSLQLKNLEKISLVMCKIRQAFSSIPIRISEAIPNLAEIIIDYCNDLVELPAGFCDLFLLKRVSITNCHKLRSLPEDLGKLTNMEVLRLNSCIELLELPESIGRLQKLRVLDISDCLSMTKLPETIGGLCNLKKLFMIDCSNCELPESVMNLTQLKEITGMKKLLLHGKFSSLSWKSWK